MLRGPCFGLRTEKGHLLQIRRFVGCHARRQVRPKIEFYWRLREQCDSLLLPYNEVREGLLL
jgi:hypothetical protein